jgi:S1-C subfamily serine protease
MKLNKATSNCNKGSELDCARRGIYLTRTGKTEEGYKVLYKYCANGLQASCQWKEELFPGRTAAPRSTVPQRNPSAENGVSGEKQATANSTKKCEDNDGQGCLAVSLDRYSKSSTDGEAVFNKALTLLSLECQAEGWGSESCTALEDAARQCPGKWIKCKILKLEIARSGGLIASVTMTDLNSALNEAIKRREKETAAAAKSEGTISTGTGFLVCNNVIATNAHVVNNTTKGIKIRKDESFVSDATILVLDANNDLALLKLADSKSISSAHTIKEFVDANSIEVGQSIFTLGFPRSDVLGRGVKMTDGRVSGLFGIGDDPSSFQISVPLQPGNSGGPIIDLQGRLVGVAVAKLIGGENVNFGVKTEYLASLIRSQKFPASANCIKPATATNSNEEKMEVLVRKTQPAVFQVVSYN